MGRRRQDPTQPQRGIQGDRRPPLGPRAHHQHVFQVGLLVHPPTGPPRKVPLVGPLYPASARHRRRKTAILEPHELADEYFMLRIRATAGSCLAQARTIARHLRRRTAATPQTSRPAEHPAALDSHRGRPEIFERVEGVGLLLPRRAATLLASSLARPWPASQGRDHRPTPAIEQSSTYIGDPRALQPAPQVQDRGHGRSASRTSSPRCKTWRSCAVEHPELGSATTCGSAAACRINPFLRHEARRLRHPDEIPEVWARRRRHLPRPRLPPIAHSRATQVPRQGVGGREVPPGARGRVPALRAGRGPRARAPSPRIAATTSASTQQKDGNCYVGTPPSPAASAASKLAAIADLAEAAGSDRFASPHCRRSSCSTFRRRVNDVVNRTARTGAGRRAQ